MCYIVFYRYKERVPLKIQAEIGNIRVDQSRYEIL